jgi:hypothetical protein
MDQMEAQVQNHAGLEGGEDEREEEGAGELGPVGGIESVTISSGDRSVTLGGKGRQLSFLDPENSGAIADHTNSVEQAIRIMANSLFGHQGTGDFTAKTRIGKRITTGNGVMMDATLTIQISAKPAK